jgi:hypothetical protein
VGSLIVAAQQTSIDRTLATSLTLGCDNLDDVFAEMDGEASEKPPALPIKQRFKRISQHDNTDDAVLKLSPSGT